MTTQSAKNLQSALGLSRILPSKAPPQVEQTPELIADTARIVADVLSTAQGDQAISVEAAFKFLEKRGVEHTSLGAVLEAAGAAIDIEAQAVRLIEAEPETVPDVFETVNRVTLANLAGELIERHPDGVIGEDGRAYCESRIAPNRKISDKRWATIVELSGLLTEEDPGYTKHPQAHDGEADALPVCYVGEGKTKIALLDQAAEADAPAADLGPAPQAPRAKARRQIAERQTHIEQGIANLEETIDALPAPALRGALVVLIDCLFEKSPDARTLSAYLAPHQEAVEAQNGVDYFEEIGFGKGPKMVMAKVLAEVMSEPPHGVFIVSSREPMAEAVIAVFRRVPGVVIIRGLR